MTVKGKVWRVKWWWAGREYYLTGRLAPAAFRHFITLARAGHPERVELWRGQDLVLKAIPAKKMLVSSQ